MTTDRNTAEAVAFRSAYQILVDRSPEAPDTLLQATGIPPHPVGKSPRLRQVIVGGVVGLGVVLLTLLGIVWLRPATPLTPVATTAALTPQAVAVPVLRIRCVPERLDDSTLSCLNAIDTTPAEFISPWQELTASGITMTIELTFPDPMVIEAIDWSNIEDPTRFLLHHRARSISIQTDNNPVPLVEELADTTGTQQIRYSAIGSRTIHITVISTWPSEAVEGSDPFKDLSIVEIAVLGYPAP